MSAIKPIYVTFSRIRYIKDYFACGGIVYIIVMLLLQMNQETHSNATFFILFLILLLFAIDTKEFAVYEDKLQIRYKYIFGLISIKKNILFSNIESISKEGNFSPSNDLLEDILSLFFPVFDLKNTLTIQTKQNNTLNYKVHIYKKNLEKIIEEFNNHSKHN